MMAEYNENNSFFSFLRQQIKERYGVQELMLIQSFSIMM
jgi:hypothetical protein